MQLLTDDLCLPFDEDKLILSAQDEKVDIKCIRPFLEPSAYAQILSRVNAHFEMDIKCIVCHHALDKEVIQCGGCLSW